MYPKVLAPDGKLMAPDVLFGEGGRFDKDVEDKTKLAFKVTMKKEGSNTSLTTLYRGFSIFSTMQQFLLLCEK